MKRGVGEMARLIDKVALITGAAGGQGMAEAELFVREGGAVALTDIDTAAGEGLAQRLSRQGASALFLRHDVANETSWQETVAAALARFGKLHILVNNAGTIARQGDRRYQPRSVEPDIGGQSDRRNARHETLRAGDPRQRRRLDHQYLLRRRTDGA